MKKQQQRRRKHTLGDSDRRGRESAIEMGCHSDVTTGTKQVSEKVRGWEGGKKEKEMNSVVPRGRKEE